MFLALSGTALADGGSSASLDASLASDGALADATTLDGGDGGGCQSSLECAPPAPYCDPSSARCVECLSDRNCAATTRLCDAATGRCIACAADTDCAAPTPYCDDAAARCVECRVDGNCGDVGLECLDGVCGACGDGICGPNERFYALFGVGLPGTNREDPGPITFCPEDCGPRCPDYDLDSRLGVVLETDTSDWSNRYLTCLETDGRDAAFVWTAPKAGTYYFTTFGTDADLGLGAVPGGCTPDEHSGSFCSAGGTGYVEMEFAKGDAILLVAELASDEDGPFRLRVSDSPLCAGPDGGITTDCLDPGDEPDAGLDQAGICRRNATMRGDPDCEGARCACDRCPLDYDDCAVIPGCQAVLECMTRTECIGDQCTRLETCGATLAAHGGPEGAAFRAAASLQSCALSFSCALPCTEAEDADSGAAPAEAGAPTHDAGTDAEANADAACTPAGELPCRCADGGTGTRTCHSNGSLSACDCAATPSTETTDGCGCRFGTHGPRRTGSLAAALLLLGIALRRARRGKRDPGA